MLRVRQMGGSSGKTQQQVLQTVLKWSKVYVICIEHFRFTNCPQECKSTQNELGAS